MSEAKASGQPEGALLQDCFSMRTSKMRSGVITQSGMSNAQLLKEYTQ